MCALWPGAACANSYSGTAGLCNPTASKSGIVTGRRKFNTERTQRSGNHLVCLFSAIAGEHELDVCGASEPGSKTPLQRQPTGAACTEARWPRQLLLHTLLPCCRCLCHTLNPAAAHKGQLYGTSLEGGTSCIAAASATPQQHNTLGTRCTDILTTSTRVAH
jgi:hypothetical protein